jgi:hypothetical protein
VYDTTLAKDRAFRDMCTTPIFRAPRLMMMPTSKQEEQLSNGDTGQAWWPWQVCTNCIAGRAKRRCSLWHAALQVQQPIASYRLRPGQASDNDRAYGWFTDDMRDGFMDSDWGYYGMWLCRDGTSRELVRSLDTGIW